MPGTPTDLRIDDLTVESPLFGLPRSATARAHTDTTLTGYTATAFRDHVGAEHLPALIRGR
jgi:putative ABC transport system ATP-binding protein